MPVKNWKQYRRKNLKHRRAYERRYKRAVRRGQLTCPVCKQFKKSVRVRVCDCNRDKLKHFA